MNGPLPVVRSVVDLRARIAGWREEGASVGLVPTMGALHEGHLSLVQASLEANARTCVTLFVNPKQFGEGEDFGAYPRDERTDAGALGELGADLLYAPDIHEMYPEDSVTAVTVPDLGDWLEGEFRPGFFTGVATVVTKLLLQALPDTAYFGEKDYQQLCLVRRLVADLDIPVAIHGSPIVRKESGLALSSRNAYLSEEQLAIAPAFPEALARAASAIRNGDDIAGATGAAEAEILDAGFAKVDYVAARDAASLEPAETFDGNLRLLGAAWLGEVRLIDNLAV
ncbi:MAG: pantoate--beta-alanine ligase [Pseudomonadota bacterium]|nr:pantoate--beta-alanine ligase [Pseudomonadota bacterium]